MFGPLTYLNLNHLNGIHLMTIRFTTEYSRMKSHRKKRHKSKTRPYCIYISVQYTYTGCPRRNGQNFGRVILMLKYTDITQNTYIQS